MHRKSHGKDIDFDECKLWFGKDHDFPWDENSRVASNKFYNRAEDLLHQYCELKSLEKMRIKLSTRRKSGTFVESEPYAFLEGCSIKPCNVQSKKPMDDAKSKIQNMLSSFNSTEASQILIALLDEYRPLTSSELQGWQCLREIEEKSRPSTSRDACIVKRTLYGALLGEDMPAWRVITTF